MSFRISTFSLLFLVILSFGACKTDGSTDKSTDATTSVASSGTFTSIPKATMQKLWDKCSLIDYIFHDLPFSMSQTEINSIRSTINYIGVEAQEAIPAGSKAICRQIWQIDGDIILEVDVHYSDLGNFFVFVDEKNKPIHANQMTDGGKAFFGQVIRQAMSQNISQ